MKEGQFYESISIRIKSAQLRRSFSILVLYEAIPYHFQGRSCSKAIKVALSTLNEGGLNFKFSLVIVVWVICSSVTTHI